MGTGCKVWRHALPENLRATVRYERQSGAEIPLEIRDGPSYIFGIIPAGGERPALPKSGGFPSALRNSVSGFWSQGVDPGRTMGFFMIMSEASEQARRARHVFRSQRGRPLRLAVVLTLSLASLTRGAQPAPPSTPVILISVDTLRADHLSCYGYARFRTPHIDSLAQGGTIFAAINTQIPLTLPSHTTLLASTYPFVTGVEENGEVVPTGTVTLAGILKARGYRTAAFIGGYFMARRFGLDQGFEVYDSPFDSTGEPAQALDPTGEPVKALDVKRPAGEVTLKAQKWLEGHDRQPFFLFVHLFDLHRPYDPPAAYRARYGADAYDAELAYVDSVLGNFKDFLVRRGLYDRTLIVFISDHGESLNEHGESTHGYFVYQSTLHVPLIIHWAQGARPYRPRVEAPAGLIDVAPTIVQALGLPLPPSFQGTSLLPLLAATAPAATRKVYSESLFAHDNFRCAPLRSLRVGNYKYIATTKPELYDLSRDPGELHNLVTGEQAKAASLRQELNALWSRFRPPEPPVRQSIDPEVRANLHALGYFEEGKPEAALEETGPDAKDRLVEYRQLLRGSELLWSGRFAEAASAFEEIFQEDPDNLTAHIDVASCKVHEGRVNDAVEQLQVALALDPHNVTALELLGTAWLSLHNLDHARAAFENLLSFFPGTIRPITSWVSSRSSRIAMMTPFAMRRQRRAFVQNPPRHIICWEGPASSAVS